jgi:hypothetical protein
VKKQCTAVLLALCAAASLAAQQVTDTSALPTISLLDLNGYASHFGFKNGVVPVNDQNYVWQASRTDRKLVRDLSGDEIEVDTPLEFALLSYYSQPVINIRPVEAKNILPANNKTSELKLGAAVYQEMQMLRFLGNTDAVGRHEGIVKFITDRGNVSRAEIESYYRQGIGTFIAAVVDEALKKQNPETVPTSNTARMIHTLVKTSFTNFFLTPNQANFNKIQKIKQVFDDNYLIDVWTTGKIAKQDIATYQKMGWTSSVASARELARTSETKVTGWLRELGVTYSEDIDWKMVWDAFYYSLEPLHTELAKRIRGY